MMATLLSPATPSGGAGMAGIRHAAVPDHGTDGHDGSVSWENTGAPHPAPVLTAADHLWITQEAAGKLPHAGAGLPGSRGDAPFSDPADADVHGRCGTCGRS